MSNDLRSPDRAFIRVAGRLVHYRTAGTTVDEHEPPVYLAHAGPGSSRSLVDVFEPLSSTRRLIAPDMPGNGDSEPHRLAAPQIADYADHAAAMLDALGIAQVDFYGQHTGAHIGCELALRHPTRVRRLVLDGLALFPESLSRSLAARYAPPIVPDGHGGHLSWAWHFVSGLTLHFPYYEQDPAHRLNLTAVPPAGVRQTLVVELLKALPTYHLAYRAAFAHPAAERLALLRHPTLLMGVDGDPLARYLEEAATIVRQGPAQLVPRARRGETLAAFFAKR